MHKNIYKWFKNVFLLSGLALPFLFTFSCSVQKPVETPPDADEDQPPSIDNADQFFPQIDPKDYYDLIEFKEHKPIISKKLKAKVIQDVISRVASNQGEINFNIEDVSEQKCIFHFQWKIKDKTFFKNYVFDFENM